MDLSTFARGTIKFGFGLSAFCMLMTLVSRLAAPYCPDPQYALLLMRSFREASLALIATTVCAALLCDIIIKKDFTK